MAATKVVLSKGSSSPLPSTERSEDATRRHAGGPVASAGSPTSSSFFPMTSVTATPGPYGGGPGRGMTTPSLDRLADEGMTFFTYAQPSCTPGRAAVQTRRIYTERTWTLMTSPSRSKR